MSRADDITREEILATVPAVETSDPARLVSDPVVSVLLMTYNHEPFLRQAVDSVLAQQGVPFELVLGDDRSTDGTLALCLDYQRRRPDVVRVITAPVNVGLHRHLLRLWARARGRYIAMLEGDDYWTDPGKLRAQVDLMEACPVLAMCGARTVDKQVCEVGVKERYDLGDITGCYVFHTSTLLFRAPLPESFPRSFLTVGKACESFLYVLLAEHGEAGFLDRFMSRYRRHEGGMWNSLDMEAAHREMVSFTTTVDGHLGGRHHRDLMLRELRVCRQMTRSALDSGDPAALRSARLLARKACPRLKRAFPVRAAWWLAGVHCLPVLGAWRRLRRGLALRRRLGRMRRFLAGGSPVKGGAE